MRKINYPHYHRLYKIYLHMKDRCYDINNNDYHRYGARGIKICDEWLNDFMNFYNWAINNSYQDDLTIDRTDNNDDYKPSNCTWATKKQQARNTRRNRMITINGETRCLVEWCEILNLNYNKTKRRLHRGWSIERAFDLYVATNDDKKYID